MDFRFSGGGPGITKDGNWWNDNNKIAATRKGSSNEWVVRPGFKPSVNSLYKARGMTTNAVLPLCAMDHGRATSCRATMGDNLRVSSIFPPARTAPRLTTTRSMWTARTSTSTSRTRRARTITATFA